MSLKEKIRNIFKKDNTPKLEDKKEILPPAKWKYGNMVLFAASKNMIKSDDNYYYITAYDEHGEPIVDEEVKIKIGNEVYYEKTNPKGVVKLHLDLKYGLHDVFVTYPNGEYSQIIETHLKIRRPPKTTNKTPVKKEPAKKPNVRLNLPKMKMYVNNEGAYYARLRNDKFASIPREELKFTIDDKVYRQKTDIRGFASIPIENLTAGKHKVTVEYEGSDKYDLVTKESELEMLVREIDKEVVIDVDHLTMEFKVTKDKIDTLKEFIIRTIKRNKKGHEKIRILDDISFKVYKGDKLGILGFNGAGKSTLLKIMSGIYEPTSGTITTKGKIAPLLELGAGFDKNYTGKNNIYLNGSFLSIDEKTIDAKYDEIVEFSELGEFINYPIKNYSSGMRSKLGFSIATQINPDILIIDEILSVGDIKFRKKSADKINSMMKDGVTVLLVTHSIKQIEKICDTCIWLEDGKIKMYGPADEVCKAYVKDAKQDMKTERKRKK
ncbi:ABC transporter ATP-binding protein [Methanobrevibacter sp.]|uniref:ABC transporter ATP-binding protein n=1 Tax=Methanobrevibacter sp. TaxID=66852 RepID=UPI00388D199D